MRFSIAVPKRRERGNGLQRPPRNFNRLVLYFRDRRHLPGRLPPNVLFQNVAVLHTGSDNYSQGGNDGNEGGYQQCAADGH